MRWAFGLVSLMVTMGVVLALMHSMILPEVQQATSHNGHSARSQAERIAGRDEEGVPAGQTIGLSDAQDSSGRIVGYSVISLTPDGAMEQYYGLRINDVITQISSTGGVWLDVPTIGDAKSASAWLVQSYEQRGSVSVNRAGTILTLPAMRSTVPVEMDPAQRAVQ